jgi:hypothetical protein
VPTPTPEFDTQGRRVFRSPLGFSFYLVVEAQTGASTSPPGQLQPVACTALTIPSQRIQASRSLGISPPIQCPPLPNQTPGVQGFPTPDLGNSPAAITALQELAKRFVIHTSSEGCTKHVGGLDGFLSSPPPPAPPIMGVRQYCLEVDRATRLPPGDTIMTVQFADASAARNLGPTAQIVIRVPTPPP